MLECCASGKEMAVYYSRGVSSMTLNDAASEPMHGNVCLILRASDSAASLLSSMLMSLRVKGKIGENEKNWNKKYECSVLL